MFYCYVEPLCRVFIHVIEIIQLSQISLQPLAPAPLTVLLAYLVNCGHRSLIDSVPQMKDAKERRMIAERYLTPKYRRVFDRVNANLPELTEQYKSAIAVDKSFQKKCPKDVSV